MKLWKKDDEDFRMSILKSCDTDMNCLLLFAVYMFQAQNMTCYIHGTVIEIQEEMKIKALL